MEWACYFNDEEIMINSIAATRKSSIRKATGIMKANWKTVRSRGIRCKSVNIIVRADDDQELDHFIESAVEQRRNKNKYALRRLRKAG